ncbi:MAG TPA: hypothetical protein EYN07_00205 [Flavobacteriaceae bacterium]|jgi:hypothetical protein|nr:hypothetical protein [Flavobacteriaceae bacterium]HIN97637.1 hypothetical protein [Flavobacteriaceae bacterium]|tara:strand:- start:147279 stop:148049 length:771 start_codon:yes stop_codon:yes gene_type:complete
MAHETHRFNLLLRNASHPSANGAASLNPIFTETSHGTHYSLYAEFSPRDPSKTYKHEFDVGKITVRLQNYTGAVTMGISSVVGINIYKISDKQKEFMVANFSTQRVIELVVSVQPLNSCDEVEINLNDKELILREGDLFETHVLHKIIDGSLSGAGRNTMDGTPRILDEKYMWRDGEEVMMEEDIWDHKGTIEMLEKAGFFINDKMKNLMQFKSANADEPVDEKDLKELLDVMPNSTKSRRNDPRCKQKTADIYIL